MKNKLIILFGLLVLSACGDPVYKTVEDIIPPTTDVGKSCVKEINEKKSACLNTCASKKSSCINNAKINAEKVLPEKLKDYQESLNLYSQELEIYSNELNVYHQEKKAYLFELKTLIKRQNKKDAKCKKSGDTFCDSFHQQKNKVSEFKEKNKPIEPIKPEKPNKPTINSLITVESCNSNCNCKSDYKSSFILCGGKIVTRKVCIKNCS